MDVQLTSPYPSLMATGSTLHSPLYRVLIRVSENYPRIERKLQKYFQNPWRSGGGKCKVKPGPREDTFWVEFYKRQAKEGVIARGDHIVAVSDTLHVNVYIEGNEDPGENNTLEISQLSSQAQALPKESPGEKNPDEGGAASSSNSFIQKIFLYVEAQLNFKLSKEQREKIISLCPNLKIEGGKDGPEKMIGDYEDIEKTYRFLSDTTLGNDQKEDFSHSASAREIKQIMPNYCDNPIFQANPKHMTEEESDLISVPSHLYEYFKYFFAETLDRIEVEHEVRIKSALVYPTGNVSLDFETNRLWDKEAAKEAFTRTFQREIQNMTHRDVHFTDNKMVLDMQKTLTDMFHNLHIKAEEKDLVLWGNQKEILEAQQFIEENYPQKQPEETAPPENANTGIEVDTAHWRVLGQEIREIEKTYYTVMELVHKPKTQKTLIVFKPKDKDLDLSAHAYEDFIDIFQMLLPQIVTEVVILTPIDLKRKCWLENTFFENLEKKHPHVILVLCNRELTLTGLPKYIEKALKYVKKYFTVESAVQQKEEPALSLGEN